MATPSYGIRVYSCVGWKNTYLQTIMDNGKGHKSNFNPSERFSKQFPSHFNGMLTDTNESHDVIDVFPSKTSCQWVIQMGLQMSIVTDRSGKSLFVMDSFYGRHKVGSVIEFFKFSPSNIKCFRCPCKVAVDEDSLVYVLNNI